MNLTKNFTLEECVRTSRPLPNVPNATITAHLKETCERMAQPLRDLYGRGLVVNSGYRSEAVNKAVGGASNSSHKYGYALDIVPQDNDMAAFVRCLLLWAERNDFDQIILEKYGHKRRGVPDWVHIGWKRSDGSQRRQVLKQVPQGKKWVYQTYKVYN